MQTSTQVTTLKRTTSVAVTNPNISVLDARVAEPTSGTTNMLFTVALSAPAPAGGTAVDYATAVGGGNPATPGSDYTAITTTTLTSQQGQQIKTVAVSVSSDADNTETDETLLVNLSNAVNGTIVDGQATGTITVANAAGTFLISELRTSGPAGPDDDFIEVHNNTNSPLTVAASDASGGYGVYKKGVDCNATPVLVGTIPNGTLIPARGHYLLVGSSYSLGGSAAGNLTLAQNLESDTNVAVFSTADVTSISSVNRLDAVGFGANTGGGVCDLLREGTNLPPVSGSTAEYSFQRDQCGKGGAIETSESVQAPRQWIATTTMPTSNSAIRREHSSPASLRSWVRLVQRTWRRHCFATPGFWLALSILGHRLLCLESRFVI